MRLFRSLFALVCAFLFSASSFAAMVNTTQGQVLVNTGQGYRQVAGSVEAGPGATVVVNPGGNAQVVYPDGCAVNVQPGSVYTVASESPCLAGGADTTTGSGGAALALGAVLVGGGVAAVLLLSDKDKSSSP
jgi:hypothetical protein